MRSAAAGLLLAATTVLGARAEPCALALALALDISSSVNAEEYAIQRDGLAAALRHPLVVEAIAEAPGDVWIAAYEWSGLGRQALIADWTRVAGRDGLAALAAQIGAHRRTEADSPTALGAAAAYGARLFSRLPAPCARHVMDISGDGVNNQGPSAKAYRDDPLFAGLTINGLVIKGATPDPEPHYREEVLWGPGAFLIVARNGFEDYSDLILGKLLKELKPPLFIGAAIVRAAPDGAPSSPASSPQASPRRPRRRRPRPATSPSSSPSTSPGASTRASTGSRWTGSPPRSAIRRSARR